MDFGFRAHLWGEEILSTQLIRISYDGEIPPEDSTTEKSYRQFYLKNLAPIFRGDSAFLPLRRFPGYYWNTKGDPFAVWKEFSEARRWVKDNCFRFKSDARSITELWDDFSDTADMQKDGETRIEY
jgi:hypothetical protein